jgi:hypothetical protein
MHQTDDVHLIRIHVFLILLLGSNPQLELHVRVFFRRVFIDNCLSDAETSLWLSMILKPFAMVDQARVLFLLFGPISYGQLNALKAFEIYRQS